MCARVVKSGAPKLRLDPERIVERCDWREIFGREGRVEIEIGIGKGRFLLSAAEARPEVLHLGVEWANKYLRMAEERADRRALENVRFARVDANDVVARGIPTASVDAYYVFYPDPWPKKRHRKRRFLRTENAEHLARTLRPGGCLHVATDHDDYWEALEPVFEDHEAFERLDTFGGPEFPLPVDGPLTNYETKYAVEGRSRHRATWRRR
ncbi:MAG: tRNA (guanosine(46)-N7)-methyltransferase TrmB [Acidobacteriota bacterium]|nr:tRNA (guanosine(46)-N7)-methyltransferase TrmB [Acidobacteriota bacterium]MDH3785880.1 tRNA (guanosine(46)-N7)-methyltransferase TrmB [Acidobacteriota bacterium]